MGGVEVVSGHRKEDFVNSMRALGITYFTRVVPSDGDILQALSSVLS